MDVRSSKWCVAVLLPTLLAGCASRPGLVSRVVYQGPHKLGGCAVAELDPSRPDAEIYAVASDGSVLQVHRAASRSFVARTLATLPGEMVQCAAGSLGAQGRVGLCAVGAESGEEADDQPGAAWWLEPVADDEGRIEWLCTKVLAEDALVHAVCLGDLRPDLPGDELLVAGFGRIAHVLGAGDDGSLVELSTVPLPEAVKSAVCDAPGSVWLAGADGGLLHVTLGRDGGGTCREARHFPDALARIDAKDGEVLVCDNGGWLHHFVAGEWQDHWISKDRLRGARIGHFTPPGRQGVVLPDLLTAGYDGRLYRVREHVGEVGEVGVEVEVLAEDSDRFHHVTTGSLDPWTEVGVACGYSGSITLVERR